MTLNYKGFTEEDVQKAQDIMRKAGMLNIPREKKITFNNIKDFKLS